MKRKILTILCSIIILLGVLLGENIFTFAATTQVTVETDKHDISSEEEIVVSVLLDSDTRIGAYYAEIMYDDYRLKYVSGGDSVSNGRVVLKGTGYGDKIVYKLTFKAVSGGVAQISCVSADIRMEGNADAQKQTVSTSGQLAINISGEDFAIQTANKEKYGVDIDIPLCGVVDIDENNRYYIIDQNRYVPDVVKWDYVKVDDKYDGVTYTFLSNETNEVRILYLVDASGNIFMYAYSKSTDNIYPCIERNVNGKKYYVMSANVCSNWPESLTLDYVRNENVCYVMDNDGKCDFYRYIDGELEPWSEEDGKAFVEGQMKVIYIILAGTLVVAVIVVVALVVRAELIKRNNKKRALSRGKTGTEEEVSPENIEFIEIEEEEPLSLQVIVSRTGTEDVLGKTDIVSLGDDEKHEADDSKTEEIKERPVISIKNVTMKFRVSTSDASGIKEYFIQKVQKKVTYREFLALDNVSFDVYKGEIVGIIGTNGSGKSTLLRIVSGALKPTAGRVRVNRKKVQLLTLGTGFDVELTARENIYLNGAIIGYTEEFIKENFDKIIEFAELQDFVDEKVKNFSSGMVSRLGFAIATIGEASEILILDEVLSVGDEFFRKKSLQRVKELIHGGSTVLMVSHGMNTILDNCTKVAWIERGKLKMFGEPKEVCDAYHKMCK